MPKNLWKNRQKKTSQKNRSSGTNGTLFQRLYESRPAMMATSVAIAIVLWFVISIAIYPTTPRTLHHVPLKVEIAGTSAEENGLSVIDYDVQDVTVQIEGNRSKVGNIDATILCQRPKLAPHIPAMRKNIADAFGLPLDAVSVKATTEEHLGFTGEGLGIAAHAVALIE